MDLHKLDRFPSVAANATSSLVTNEMSGRSVQALVLELGGTTFNETHISNIRVRLDGRDIINAISGSQLKDLNEYDGHTSVTNYLFIFFGDPTARTARGQHLGDLDLSIYDKPLEIEVDIAGATAPTLQAYAIAGVPKMAMGYNFSAIEAAHFRHIRRSIVEPTAAVSRNSYGISLGSKQGGRIRKLAFFHSNLTSVELRKESLYKWDNVSQALNDAIAQQFARVPQSGLYVLDRVVDGNQGEAETTATPDGKPWHIETNLSTSGADTIYVFADMHAAMPMI